MKVLAAVYVCCVLSHVRLFVTPWAAARQAPLSTGIQNTGVGSLFSSPGDLPNLGIEPGSPALQADSLPAEPPGKPHGLVVRHQTQEGTCPSVWLC